MWEKASSTKKTHPLKLPSLPSNAMLSTPFFCIFLHFQFRSKLRSVRLLHLHLFQTFLTRLCIQLIRLKLHRNYWTIVLPHLHHLIRIQSLTLNRRQHLFRIQKHFLPTGILSIPLPKAKTILLVLQKIALS